MIYIIYVVICFVATGIGAICGVGGGIIIRPVMEAISPLPVSTISFISSCTVLAMSVASFLSTRKTGIHIGSRQTVWLAVGAAAGGIGGKFLFDFIRQHISSEAYLGIVQNVSLAILTLGTFVYMLNRKSIRTRNIESSLINTVAGFVLGLISSFLGIGGGPFNLAVLAYFFSMDSKTAATNSILIIMISQAAGLANTFVLGTVPSFDWIILIIMVITGTVGGVAGRRCAKHIDNSMTDKLFYALLAAITLICAYNICSLSDVWV